MFARSLMAAGILAGAMMVSQAADAAPGQITGNVNLRTGPGVGYPKITTIPAGAPVNVFTCQSWCNVAYGGWQGWVSANYVATGGYVGPGYPPAPPPPSWGPPGYYRPPPPLFGYYRRPWWDDRYRAWYDGNRWYYNGGWYNTPTFSFGFGFGN